MCFPINRGQVECIKQKFSFFCSTIVQLPIIVFLYSSCTIKDKIMHYQYLLPKVVQFLLQDNSTKSLNKKYHDEQKSLVLTKVFFVKGFGCVILKLKLHNYWT